MPNYTPTNTPGTARRRAHTILIHYPDAGTPAITWVEQDRVALADGEVVYVEKGSFVTVVDAARLQRDVPVMDPATNTVLGHMSGGQLLAAMYGLFIDEAALRDEAVVAEEALVSHGDVSQ